MGVLRCIVRHCSSSSDPIVPVLCTHLPLGLNEAIVSLQSDPKLRHHAADGRDCASSCHVGAGRFTCAAHRIDGRAPREASYGGRARHSILECVFIGPGCLFVIRRRQRSPGRSEPRAVARPLRVKPSALRPWITFSRGPDTRGVSPAPLE